MTTDYKNLSPFEVSAVLMAVAGLALIVLQIFIAMPEQAKASVTDSLQVFEMSGAIAEVWEIEMDVNNLVFNGMEEFQEQFHLALMETFKPVAQDAEQIAVRLGEMKKDFMQLSDTIALNYHVNFNQPGVEADLGGKVMGAFIEKLSK